MPSIGPSPPLPDCCWTGVASEGWEWSTVFICAERRSHKVTNHWNAKTHLSLFFCDWTLFYLNLPAHLVASNLISGNPGFLSQFRVFLGPQTLVSLNLFSHSSYPAHQQTLTNLCLCQHFHGYARTLSPLGHTQWSPARWWPPSWTPYFHPGPHSLPSTQWLEWSLKMGHSLITFSAKNPPIAFQLTQNPSKSFQRVLGDCPLHFTSLPCSVHFLLLSFCSREQVPWVLLSTPSSRPLSASVQDACSV